MPASNQAYLSPTPEGGLRWGPLTPGVLVKRYKRFLADVRLDDGQTVTAHTPNTGRMIGCSEPGRPVWLSRHDGGTRKYAYTLEMIAMPTALVGVDTAVPNRLVRAAALAGAIPEFPFPAEVRSEVRHGDSRLDLGLRADGSPDVLVEIKNCTLVEKGAAYFPDAVTERGRKHLVELIGLAKAGARAVLFILVQRGDAEWFGPADHIDPAWGETLRRAAGEGVEALAYRADLDLTGIRLGRRLPVRM